MIKVECLVCKTSQNRGSIIHIRTIPTIVITEKWGYGSIEDFINSEKDTTWGNKTNYSIKQSCDYDEKWIHFLSIKNKKSQGQQIIEYLSTKDNLISKDDLINYINKLEV